jgi:hypothetical protein
MANHSGNIKFPNPNLLWQRVAFKKKILKKALLVYPCLTVAEMCTMTDLKYWIKPNP